jgi:hypothetical protein
MKQRIDAWQESSGIANWKGRSFTSAKTLLSLPLVDVQVSNPIKNRDERQQGPRVARGWIAIGDRAQGVLLGIGGRARGIVAIGGVSVGIVSFGGIAIGLVGVGGLAIGLLSLAGLAVGHTAIGGCSIGWDTAGGAAIGWHSAAGGLAVSNHVAMGGLAVARDFAVGGQAIAAQANTPAAHQAVKAESLKTIIDWIAAHQAWFIASTIVLSLAPLLLIRLFYHRDKSLNKGALD